MHVFRRWRRRCRRRCRRRRRRRLGTVCRVAKWHELSHVGVGGDVIRVRSQTKRRLTKVSAHLRACESRELSQVKRRANREASSGGMARWEGRARLRTMKRRAGVVGDGCVRTEGMKKAKRECEWLIAEFLTRREHDCFAVFSFSCFFFFFFFFFFKLSV